MIEVDARQAQRIRELVAAGTDPDEAVRKVLATPTPTASATPAVEKKPRKNKYGAVKVTIDGITFDSTKEGNRYKQLKGMQELGIIRFLELQPTFPLHAGGKVIGKYIADFRYRDLETDEVVIEDVKGVKTPIYRWKKKHVEAEYGITITEV